MRYTKILPILAIVFSFHAVSVFSDGSTNYHGFDKYGKEYVLYNAFFEFPEDFSNSRRPFFPYKTHIVKNGKWEKSYKTQFCRVTMQDHGRYLICAKDGKSPFAGTVYKRTRELKKCRGTLYVCKKGCGSPYTPKEISSDPWECHVGDLDMTNYTVACQPNNNSEHGVIYGNNVALRTKPNRRSKTISRLMNLTGVTILKRLKKCLYINSEKGQWVFVEEDDIDGQCKTCVKGWMFDAYIEYPN